MARWAEALAESTRLTRLMAVLWMQARQMFERGGGEPGGLLEHGSGAGTEGPMKVIHLPRGGAAFVMEHLKKSLSR